MLWLLFGCEVVGDGDAAETAGGVEVDGVLTFDFVRLAVVADATEVEAIGYFLV
ncbi:hypothetical protein IKE99_01960 [Candidatus Saccharibacteria bacterium]|nr:hypothetical protein [Candidatus Saccharibacteria bacterium]